MPARIAGVILRAGDRKRTAEFYAKLGLDTHEHSHGGPKHYEVGPFSHTAVTEIYQRSAKFSNDAIMIEVDSIDTALLAVAEFGIEPKSNIANLETMKFVYTTDPDGRDVILMEGK